MGFVLVHLAPLLEFSGLWAEFLAFAEVFVVAFKLALVLFEFLGVFILAEFVFGFVEFLLCLAAEFLFVFAFFVCEIWVLWLEFLAEFLAFGAEFGAEIWRFASPFCAALK